MAAHHVTPVTYQEQVSILDSEHIEILIEQLAT